MARGRKMTDDEVLALIEGEEASAIDANYGELQRQRSDALDRYRGKPLGNEQEGRSQIVSKDIADTIEWIVPSLIRIYMGGDEIGKFEPRGPEDEEAARTETQCVNWMLMEKNDAFSQITACLKDALLLKNGYLAALWTTRDDVMQESYKGLSDEEVTLLTQDAEIEVVEHTEYPDPVGLQMLDPTTGQPLPPSNLHDVRIERKQAVEYVAVECIPPDEMLISRRHRWTSLVDCDFVQWRRRVSIGQLRSEGFDVPDDAPSYEDFGQQSVSRDRFGNETTGDDSSSDPTRRIVEFRDSYIRADLDGKGEPKLWRVCSIGGSRETVMREEIEMIPFAAFTGIVYPHSHVGMAVYDMIDDLGQIKTTLQRQLLDNVYIANNQRLIVSDRVNLDDLMTAGPGRHIRVDGTIGDALAPLVTPQISGELLGALEYFDNVKEQRTGVTRYSAGLDANSLNKTATGIQQIQSAANQRIELIARTLASGFRDLFLIMHHMMLKHSTKPLQLKLNNKWVQINPREWAKRNAFSISVGLGTGSPEAQIQKLVMIGNFMQQGAGLGLVGRDEFYNWATELLKAAGYKNPDKFVKAPDPNNPPPPQQNPLLEAEKIKAMSAQQIAQMRAQSDLMTEKAKLEKQAATEAAQAQADLMVQQQKLQMDAKMKEFELRAKAELESAKHQLEQQNAMEIERLKSMTSIEVARINNQLSDGGAMMKMEAALNGMTELVTVIRDMQQQMNAPKEIVRGPDGRALGVRTLMQQEPKTIQ